MTNTLTPDVVPIELSSEQMQVVEILKSGNSEEYALADWYIGAIYAASNKYNPDRFSQAAQSLRELLEKLPRVFVQAEIQEAKPDFIQMRKTLYSKFCSDKSRYKEEWKGKSIDAKLDKTIRCMDSYLSLNQKPTRKEQIHSVFNILDPMYDSLDLAIRSEKSARFQKLWSTFEGLAHHKISVNEKQFWEHIASVDRLIIDMLAPITAQDQGVIRELLLLSTPEHEDIERLLHLIKRRGENYAYFFKLVDDPVWLEPLVKNGFFKGLPNIEASGDGRIKTPLWWPIFYLQKASEKDPELIVETILDLEPTDNPRILREIFSIACSLEMPDLSVRLKSLIKKFLKSPYRWGECDNVIRIIDKWGVNPRTLSSALEIVQYVVAFQSDPNEEEKRAIHQNELATLNTSLEPAPRFDQWIYQEILDKAVRPLANTAPYEVAQVLIDSTSKMIELGVHHKMKKEYEDYSESWCSRLAAQIKDDRDVRETLVCTMTYACEQVYTNNTNYIERLDTALRRQPWKLFKRLRQHLYALYPNEQTLPWIRKFILNYENFGSDEYHYEFQLMLRKACEHFGMGLLSVDELTTITDAIQSGPSKSHYREWMGDRYSEELFQQRQHYFHRAQLRPFASLLTGTVKSYYEELVKAESSTITDDSYSPIGESSGGYVSYRSPKSVAELESFTDVELLNFINDWSDERRDSDDWLVEINISALADAFLAVFQSKIAPDSQRLSYWLAHRDGIKQPIYIAKIVSVMQEQVNAKDFTNLLTWIEFCQWLLNIADTKQNNEGVGAGYHAENDWSDSRREVANFVAACVKKEIEAPISAREGLAGLLRTMITQADTRLDEARQVLLNRDDPITEAINNVRSRALETLINFGLWVRRLLETDPVAEVANILSKRIEPTAQFPLTRPEYAILGGHFINLWIINPEWVIEQKESLFPTSNLTIWRDAFGSYIRFNQPNKRMFEVLREQHLFAMENLTAFLTLPKEDKGFIDRLGQHIFTYYIWDVFPLSGEASLIEQFYLKTDSHREYWARLFHHVGRSFKNSGKQLDSVLIERAISFFEWRFATSEPIELHEFNFWLEAECFTAEWRLQAYLRVLNFGFGKDTGLYSALKVLNKLLSEQQSLVVECFAKITDLLNQRTQMHLSENTAKPILRSGLTSEDPEVRTNAERARENLLRLGRFDFLELD